MASDTRFSDIKRLLNQNGWTLIRISGSRHVFFKKGGGRSRSRSTRGGSRVSTPGKSSVRSAVKMARPDRPFDPAVWRRAAAISRTYSLVIEPETELGFFGRTLELPFVMSGGRTPMKCVESVLEATAVAVATMLEEGEAPPAPAREGKRTQQVNIRLSAEEKIALEGIAAREGYRSISDYVRASILRRAG